MATEFRWTVLSSLGLLRFAGPEARKFLQGQLSNDVAQLAAGRVMHAGLHNAQGRALALLRLVAIDDTVLAILPAELVEPIARQLGRFVLRAKVQISDVTGSFRLLGVIGATPAASAGIWLPLSGVTTPRGYLLQTADAVGDLDGPQETHTSWSLQEIADGLPQVFASTSGQFVAQMLNLDCIEGISFTKGCYTGQEIIARAHYRGRIKRRMQRFRSRAPLALHPGEAHRLADGRAIQVVQSAVLPDGRSEFLAVAALAAQMDADHAASTADAPLACDPLPLPYAVPD